jgi:hypothetical protein
MIAYEHTNTRTQTYSTSNGQRNYPLRKGTAYINTVPLRNKKVGFLPLYVMKHYVKVLYFFVISRLPSRFKK